eukprot:TRINITY_DN10641_c0_g1_i1.p2 TRINITY_DN10641_c0_g1~~TRINITY_DN10641_c0_g1_i1.p2  ORF type:complete len:146 (-),score=6.29 TRINITY_DN10641_c0_g1_i1:23-460(-)
MKTDRITPSKKFGPEFRPVRSKSGMSDKISRFLLNCPKSRDSVRFKGKKKFWKGLAAGCRERKNGREGREGGEGEYLSGFVATTARQTKVEAAATAACQPKPKSLLLAITTAITTIHGSKSRGIGRLQKPIRYRYRSRFVTVFTV